MAGSFRSAQTFLGRSAPHVQIQAGIKGFLWRWGGGASAPSSTPPPPPPEERSRGAGTKRKRTRDEEEEQFLQEALWLLERDDLEMVELLAIILPLL